MKNFTKKITNKTLFKPTRWLIMALMMLVGTSSAWATIDVYPGETIIIDVSSHGWFNNDNCYPKLYCGNTVIGQASSYESDKKYEITLTITSVVNGTLYVSRCNSNGEYNKQYIDDRSSSKINTFQITSDGNGKWNTTQSSTNIYYLRGLGDFDKWNNIKNPYTIYLNKGDYEFKIYDSNDNWYGNDGTMTRDNCSGWTMETDKNNCKITADVAGNYTFTFNSTTKKLTVTYPELPCYTLSDVDPGTISSNATNNAICGSGSVELTLSNTTSKDDLTRTIQWQKYIGNEWSDITNATSTTYTETISATTTYRAKVKWEKSGCDDLIEYSSVDGFTITVNALPGKPIFDAIPAQCGSYTLPEEDKNKVKVNWYNANGNEITSVTQSGTYYAEAVDGTCVSENRTDVEITINTKPTINISGSEEAVLYEDVTLTATATEGATVKWYEGGVEKGEGLTYVVTSETETSKTITAKAFLGDCESDFKEHEVTFSAAEDCTPTPDNTKIEIWCQVTGTTTPYCHAFNITPSGNNGFANWPGLTHTSKSGDYYIWTLDNTNGLDISNNKVGIVFSKNSSGDNQTADITTLYVGNRYYFTYNANSNDKNTNYTQVKSEPLTTPVPLSAPAVKTVSATSEEGSGVVNFTGKIIKTGCAATSSIYYGYQFKKEGEDWPTTGVEASNTPVKGKLIPLTNASETALYYQFSANVENLEDGDYHFRAYIINGYDFTNGNYDQGVYYGLDKLVTVSTVQTPVTRASIELTESNGTPVANDKKYCVGETGYIKVTSDVKYTTIQWETDKGTEIDVNGNNGIYSFVAKGDDNIWVMLSNRHNNPESPAINENPLVINTFADPILPRVSLNKVSICSNDEVGATVKLTNVVKGQTYQLYQQIVNRDETFTEQAIGDAKTQTEDVTDETELVLHTLNNTYTTGKYFVKTYTAVCEANKVATQPFTFTVVDAAEVFISIEPTSAETTPWMPAKFTVNASDKYILNVTKGNPAEPATEVEVNQNDNKVSVKIPLPEGTQHVTGQYQNVTFPQGATTQYTIIATLSAAGGDNPCAAPTDATITLVPYVEECTIGH